MGATVRQIDMTNVKESTGINKKRIPAGDYAAVIKKVEDAISKKDEEKTPQYLFHIQIKDHPSTVLPYYCKLQENQLWKLRNILVAAGKTVPKKKVKIDPNQIVGKLIGVTVEDTEYEGKEQSEIDGVFPASELDDSVSVSGSTSVDDDDDDVADDSTDDLDIDEAAEEEPEAAAEEEAEEEDEAEEEAAPADPYAELDRTELKTRIKAAQPDFRVLKSMTDDDLRDALRKIDGAAKAKPKAADEDIDDLDIDDL